MPADPLLFVSYSRRDYYFAESLTFHLLRAGVQAWMDVKDLRPGNDWERDLERALDAATTLLLVVSPQALESERVRVEWQRALRRGCRVVVARFRNATLPAELRACEAIDFRGAFGGALRALTALLAADAKRGGASSPSATRGLPLPPWVVVMTLALAIPIVGYFLGASWDVSADTEYRTLVLLVLPFGALGLVWFFCVAFLRRRMGMTRLALCLSCLALVFALPTLGYFFRGLAHLANDEVAARFSEHWRLGILFLTVPIAGLAILVLVRPEDLLRWTPTGKAWASYRIGHVADAAFARAELASQFADVKAFTLTHDPADAPMAQRLREELNALGASEASRRDNASTSVLLLTNRTQSAWIDAQTEHLRGEGLTVIGTGIDLPPSLDWLWRRQWIDFRRWDMRRSDRALALPQVPDAVTQTRLPAVVARTQHVLCALAALVYAIAGAMSDDNPQPDDASAAGLLAMLTFAAALWWGWIAHRLVKRSWTVAQLLRAGMIACAVTVIVVALDWSVLPGGKLTPGRVFIAFVLLVGAWIWLWRERPRLAFWLPQEELARAAKRSALGKYRDWSTLIWLLVYALLWIAVFGLA